MKTQRSKIDWEAVKTHLSENTRRLEDAARTDADTMQKVFEHRAKRLAMREMADHTPADALMLLQVRIGQERCAIELSELSGIVPLLGYTPVPGTDTAVLGVMSVRGEVHTVIDPERLLKAGHLEDHEIAPGYAVLLRQQHDALSLYVRAAEQVEVVNRDDLKRPEDADSALALQYIKTLTPDGVAILDIQAILVGKTSLPAETEPTPIPDIPGLEEEAA